MEYFTPIPIPKMNKLLKLSLAAICVANLASAQTLLDYQFNEDAGTNAHNAAVNAGSASARIMTAPM